ncbi:MAG: SBBP repeat-containing protein [Terracidiphilus sp.]
MPSHQQVAAKLAVSFVPDPAKGRTDDLSVAHGAVAAPAQATRLSLTDKMATQSLEFYPIANPNNGARFVANGVGYSLTLGDASMLLTSYRKRASDPAADKARLAAVGGARAPSLTPQQILAESATVEFVGADRSAKAEGLEPSTAYANFMIGNDPAKWRSHVTGYGRVRFTNVYPGIDLIYHGEIHRKLEYDLLVAPGADPRQIRLRISGVRDAQIGKGGELELNGSEGGIRLDPPMLYQNFREGKKAVAGGFVRLSRNEFGFRTTGYDTTKPLIIDPTITLVYSTYMGGRHPDDANDIVVDASGNSYIVGSSASVDFPVSANAYQTIRSSFGTETYDATVSNFTSSGVLLYSTYLGGSANNYGNAIAIDTLGNAYITGSTASTDFPTTANAYSTNAGAGYIAELSPDGSTLEYSSYYNASGNVLALNSKGQIVIAGTAGPGLQTTTGSYMPTLASGDAAFAAIFDLTKTGAQQLVAATYYGTDSPMQNNVSTGNDAIGLALDNTGNIWIGGGAYTPNLPTTSNAFQPTLPSLSGSCVGNGAALNSAAYIAELSSNLSNLEYATYFSGMTSGTAVDDCSEFTSHLVFDSMGNLYAIGGTASATFPVTAGVFQSTNPSSGGGSSSDFVGWVAKFAPNQPAPTWSSYFGGNGGDTFFSGTGHGSVIDTAGNLWIAGESQGGSNFPISANAYQAALGGSYDGFVSQINPSGTAVQYSTYIGGSGSDIVDALAIDPQNNLYLAGATDSTNFPLTADALQSQFGEGCPSGCDGNDMFFSILGTGTIGIVSPTLGGNTGDSSITITGAGFESGATCNLVQGGTTIEATLAIVNSTGTSITCIFPLNGAATGSYSVVVTNPNGGASLTESNAFTVESGGQPKIWISVVGRQEIRVGTPTTFSVTVGNSGTVNAYEIPVSIAFPGTVTGNIVSTSLMNLDSDGFPNPGQNAWLTGADGNTYIPLQIPAIAAGSSVTIPIQITAAQVISQLPIESFGEAPWYDSLQVAQTELAAAALNPSGVSSTCTTNPAQPALIDCLGPWVNSFTSAIVDAVPSSGPSINQTAVAKAGIQLLINDLDQTASSSKIATAAEDAYVIYTANTGQSIGTVIQNPITGILNLLPEPYKYLQNDGQPVFAPIQASPTLQAQRPALFLRSQLSGNLHPFAKGDYGENSGPAPDEGGYSGDAGDGGAAGAGDSGSCSSSSSGGSIDPNYKAGSLGDGSANQYVPGSSPLNYSVGFENEATATLPAAAVVVTDQLDPTKVDLNTLSLGAIAFGSNIISLPSGTKNYTTNYAPPGVTAYVVRIQGSLNTTTGLLKWTFQTIDPSTGLPPTDPTVGFLPPDTDGIVGQGSVLFSIMPLAAKATGTQLTNTASVVFDTNAPISTPTWLNTLDATPPVSSVTALPADEPTTSGQTASFTVSWSGTDTGSGVNNYNIYVSDNGGPFTVWQFAVTTTSASYTGTLGHTYGFYSIVTDNVGNVQASKTSADTTTIVTAAPTPTFSLSNNGPITFEASAATGNTATIAVAPANGFTGAVNLTCAVTMTPANPTSPATCAVTPSVTITSAASQNATLTVTTTTTTTAGAYVVTVTGASGAIMMPTTVNITVSAYVAPSFALTNSGSISIGSPGATTGNATTITVMPSGGFTGSVTLTAALTSGPSGAIDPPTFSFGATSPVSITGASNGTGTLTVTTTAATTGALVRPRSLGSPWYAAGGTALACLLFFGIPAGRRRWWSMLGMFVLLALLTGGLVSCGSKSSGSSGNSGTTPGSYTITVTGSSGSITQTTTVTLTVN